MKITGARTAVLRLPFDPPLRTTIHAIEAVECVLLWLETDDGAVGEGLAMTMNGRSIGALHSLTEELAQRAIGTDPHACARFWSDCWNGFNFIGHKGLQFMALTAVDLALWDLVGKAAGKPLHHLWGASRDKVRAYASGGLWLSMDDDALVRQAGEFVAAGFTAVKMRVGSPRIADDLRRLRLVRDAIGPDVDLMVDANQGLSVKHAIRLGRAMEEFDLFWFEEPVAYWNLDGHRRVRDAIPMPLASGETDYTRQGMRAMLEAGACDILMPDLQRMGGYTEFLKAGHIAEAFDVPVTPHLFSEHSLCLAGALENCTIVEHMPWFERLFDAPLELDGDGCLAIPAAPGHGMQFSEKAVERFAK